MSKLPDLVLKEIFKGRRSWSEVLGSGNKYLFAAGPYTSFQTGYWIVTSNDGEMQILHSKKFIKYLVAAKKPFMGGFWLRQLGSERNERINFAGLESELRVWRLPSLVRSPRPTIDSAIKGFKKDQKVKIISVDRSFKGTTDLPFMKKWVGAETTIRENLGRGWYFLNCCGGYFHQDDLTERN